MTTLLSPRAGSKASEFWLYRFLSFLFRTLFLSRLKSVMMTVVNNTEDDKMISGFIIVLLNVNVSKFYYLSSLSYFDKVFARGLIVKDDHGVSMRKFFCFQ